MAELCRSLVNERVDKAFAVQPCHTVALSRCDATANAVEVLPLSGRIKCYVIP